MPKSSLFILFCKTDADFHQIATFIRSMAVYSRHTVSFLDLTYSCRSLFYDTFDKTVTRYPGHGTKMWFLQFSWDVKEIFSLLIFTCLLLGYNVS